MGRLEGFKDVVRGMLNDGVTHSEMVVALREAVLSVAEKMPKIHVAICGTHGGYGYSKGFEKYLDENGVDRDDVWCTCHRKDIVPYIGAYGAVCFALYPEVARMVEMYLESGSNAERVVSGLVKVGRSRRGKQKIHERYKAIVEKGVFGEEECTSFFSVIAPYHDACSYTRESVDVCYERAVATYTKDEMEGMDTLAEVGCTGEEVEAMLEEFATDKRQEAAYGRDDWRGGEDGGYMDFEEAIAKYGLDHWAIWLSQYELDPTTMRYIKNKGVEVVPQVDPQVDPQVVHMKMGLMFASSPYCKLVIAEVFQLLDWKIKEYDGLESIVVA